MSDPYSELEEIWTRFVHGDRSNTESDILGLLNRQGIRMRQDDGAMKQLTVSKPTSETDALVLGLRYIKRDGTQTEDHFLFRRGRRVECCYRGTLEQQLPEYRGTHKQQVLFTLVGNPPMSLTSVNTVTLVRTAS